MASTVNRFGSQLVRHSFRTRPVVASRRWGGRPTTATAQFHLSVYLRDDENAASKKSGGVSSSSSAKKSKRKGAAAKTAAGSEGLADEVVNYGEVVESDGIEREGFLGWPVGMTPAQKEKEIADFEKFLEEPPEDQREAVEEFKRMASKMEREISRAMDATGQDVEVDERDFPEDRLAAKRSFMSEGEDDPDEEAPDDEVEGDDMTSLAHGELEQHREIRHYMRLAAWEMPLLAKYAKPFELPGKDRPLRFRHTSYMGESHPAEKKIVLEFCTGDLPLTPQQRLKLIKLVGTRYDPQTDIVKMSCEMYDTPAQNKRYLGDLVDTLMVEARNESEAEGGQDKFDDLAPDFRHVKWKKRFAFPEAWKMTPERQRQLEQARQQSALAEQQRREQGLLVDGAQIIEEANNKSTEAIGAGGSRTAVPVRSGSRLRTF